MAILIADSGATKSEWCFIDDNNRKKRFSTQGISPYFLNTEEIEALLRLELLPGLKNSVVLDEKTPGLVTITICDSNDCGHENRL